MTFFLLASMPLLAFGLLVASYRRKKRFLETPLPLKVVAWRHYGDRFTAITLEDAAGRTLPAWTPGSHIVIEVAGAQGKHRRAYSLMGGEGGRYRIVVARQPGGKVSGHLHDHLEIGQAVYALPPRGRFFKLERSPHDHVCLIGGGVGIAPLIPMARQALQLGREVRLIHAVRTSSELVEWAELQALSEREPGFTYIGVVSREAVVGPGLLHGRLDAALLARCGIAAYAGDVYVCGGDGFVQDVLAHVRHNGCSGTLFHESFTGNAEDLPHRIAVDGKAFVQGHAPTLLAACEANGVQQFAECRTGHCLNCRATLKHGKVKWLVQNARVALPPDTVLTCACVPDSDIELELQPSSPRSRPTMP